MAVLNLCLCAKVPTISNLVRTTSLQQNSTQPIAPSISVPAHHAPQGIETRSLWESISKVSLIAVLSTSIVFASNPALAFKGGGPYGAGVTRGQDLTGKDFSGKDLIKQDFKTSILRQANFKGAKLLGASFFDADLTGATGIIGKKHKVHEMTQRTPTNCFRIDFTRQVCKGADLSDSDLRGADFSLANLTKANLSNANLEGVLATGNTSFKGSTITGADFTDVPLRDDQRKYLCKVADGVNPVTGNETRETLLCR